MESDTLAIGARGRDAAFKIQAGKLTIQNIPEHWAGNYSRIELDEMTTKVLFKLFCQAYSEGAFIA